MCAAAFTLVELLLVMTVLTVVLALAAPTLGNFFHGRTLDSEARRMLALVHDGQSRAVSEGAPMVLWVDPDRRAYGLEEEPGWVDQDAKAEEFSFDKDLQIEIVKSLSTNRVSAQNLPYQSDLARTSSRNVPEIRFLPDGSVGDSSFAAVRLTDRNNVSLWLARSTNRLNYEITSQWPN